MAVTLPGWLRCARNATAPNGSESVVSARAQGRGPRASGLRRLVHRLTAKIYRGSEMPETDTALVRHGWLATPSVGAAAERQNLGVAVGRRIIGSAERRPVAVHVHECVLRRASVRHPTPCYNLQLVAKGCCGKRVCSARPSWDFNLLSSS